jgi:hypothetical protein
VFNLPDIHVKSSIHLHKKNVSTRNHPKQKKKKGSALWLQLAFKCKQPAFYANYIRKNWHSGKIKVQMREDKFKLQIFPQSKKIFLDCKMVKISIFPLGKNFKRYDSIMQSSGHKN